MNDHLSNQICKFCLNEHETKQTILFRLRSNVDDNDEVQVVVDTYVTPSTPVGQSGTFGGLEPPVSTITNDFTMPLSDYKWNQIVELQLSDGRKVLNRFFFDSNKISFEISLDNS